MFQVYINILICVDLKNSIYIVRKVHTYGLLISYFNLYCLSCVSSFCSFYQRMLTMLLLVICSLKENEYIISFQANKIFLTGFFLQSKGGYQINKYWIYQNACSDSLSEYFSYFNLCLLDTSKQVLLQTVKTQMKCSIMLHFIMV